MRKKLLFFLIFTIHLVMENVHAQEKPAFFELGRTNFSIGSTHGVQPNYISNIPKNYFYGEFDSRIRIASLPFYLTGRISNEKYRSGRPSYFKLSFDANSLRRNLMRELNDSISLFEDHIAEKQKTIDSLESKISYLNLAKFENSNLPPISNELTTSLATEIPNELPNLSADGYSIPSIDTLSISTPSELDVLDDYDLDLENLNQQLELEQQALSGLENQLLNLQQEKEKLNLKKDIGFFKGINKVDVGLSTLSQGSLSKNAIPMQGLHVAGTINKYFYDVAVGLTFPNQLFSTSAFDQLIDNNANVFNLGNFFNNQTTRLVSSLITGYGEKDIRSIAVESFYTGKTLTEFKEGVAGTQNISTNLNACYTLKKYPFLTLNGTLGYTSHFNDSTPRKESEKLAYGGGLKFEIRKISTLVKVNYRSLGSSYDGYAQGIYLNGSKHFDASIKKEFGRTFITTLRYANDQFASGDSIQPISKTNLGGIDIIWKLGAKSSLYGTYSLVQSATFDHERNLSQLAKCGLYISKKIKTVEWINTLDGAYAFLEGADSNQTIFQGNLKSEIRFKKWFVSTKATYQKMEGLKRLYGENWIITPEIGVKLKDFEAGVSYQFSCSDQFRNSTGLQAYFSYSPSPYVSWSFSATKWLPSEYTLFLPEVSTYQQPYFFKVKLSIHLNVNK